MDSNLASRAISHIRRSFTRGHRSTEPNEHEPTNTNEDVKLDFTTNDVDRDYNVATLAKGSVSEIKIHIKDIGLLTKHLQNKTSLVRLKIRPNGVAEEDDELEDRRSPQSFEKISYDCEQFIEILGKFQNLEYLHFDNDDNVSTGLLENIEPLQKLQTLILQNCGISSVSNKLSPILRFLEFSSNKLSQFPNEVLVLECLETLDLSNNCISNLPKDIDKLKNLEKLVMSNNILSELPESILNLKSLHKLYLSFNEIKSLPFQIGKMCNMTHLELRGNRLTSLPASIGELCQLKKLNLCDNRITALPKELCKLDVHDDALLLAGNPLHHPPAEICANGKNSIKDFFEALHDSKGKLCRRLKAVLIGESFAGKTSLVHALVYGQDGNIQPDDRTVGLDYYTWKLKPLEDPIEVLLVDCAGQRQYLLTHQFFFAQGVLFILCVDLSEYKDESNHNTMVGDWINLVISQVPGATILIVPTHLDICKRKGIDYMARCESLLQKLRNEETERIQVLENEMKLIRFNENLKEKLEKLSHLKQTRPKLSLLLISTLEDHETQNFDDEKMALVPVCCKKDLDGVAILRKEIERIAENKVLCPIVSKDVPENWLSLEEKVLSLKHGATNFMPVKTLLETCAESCNLTESSFYLALSYFNDIGLICYFQKVRLAKHLVFLNPEWLVELLQMLFRIDHSTTLNYNNEIQKEVRISNDLFQQDKELFLGKGLLSQTLLRCIWLPKVKGVEDSDFLSKVVGVFQHFGIICQLKESISSDDITYFIPWFVAEEEPKDAKDLWMKHDIEENSDVVTRVDIGVGRLPTSVSDRLLVSAQSCACLCIPWKSGFLIIHQHYKFRCQINNGRLNSSVTLHGKSKHGYVRDVWKLVLFITKKLYSLVSEWNGMVLYNWYSICPCCVRKSKPKPFIFRKTTAPCPESIACHKCNEFVNSIQIQPPLDLLEVDADAPDSRQRKTEPLTDLEISDVASMIGVAHTRLAKLLGLSENEVQVIQADYHTVYEQAVKILHKWKRDRGGANRSDLLSAIKRLENPDQKLITFLETGIK